MKDDVPQDWTQTNLSMNQPVHGPQQHICKFFVKEYATLRSMSSNLSSDFTISILQALHLLMIFDVLRRHSSWLLRLLVFRRVLLT
jgi:hypothetical protein